MSAQPKDNQFENNLHAALIESGAPEKVHQNNLQLVETTPEVKSSEEEKSDTFNKMLVQMIEDFYTNGGNPPSKKNLRAFCKLKQIRVRGDWGKFKPLDEAVKRHFHNLYKKEQETRQMFTRLKSGKPGLYELSEDESKCCIEIYTGEMLFGEKKKLMNLVHVKKLTGKWRNDHDHIMRGGTNRVTFGAHVLANRKVLEKFHDKRLMKTVGNFLADIVDPQIAKHLALTVPTNKK